jgi:protein-L-isoaspartate(D-aspartate) O-methyltransferase
VEKIERLLVEIEREVADTQGYTGCARLSRPVIEAMRSVPRERFVPADLRCEAYGNYPLPIGQGQTISQPYIVAIMTELLGLSAKSRVLEVGTGSGYQAAILSRLAAEVFSVERVRELGEAARRVFEELGYDNIRSRVGDGYFGWPEKAPFDAIIVTAAAPAIPPPLIEQLDAGGRLIAPVEDTLGQTLVLVTRDSEGRVHSKPTLPVAFVPLTGNHELGQP